MVLPVRSRRRFSLCNLRHIMIPSRFLARSVKSLHGGSFWIGQPLALSVLSAVVVLAFYVAFSVGKIGRSIDRATFPL